MNVILLKKIQAKNIVCNLNANSIVKMDLKVFEAMHRVEHEHTVTQFCGSQSVNWESIFSQIKIFDMEIPCARSCVLLLSWTYFCALFFNVLIDTCIWECVFFFVKIHLNTLIDHEETTKPKKSSMKYSTHWRIIINNNEAEYSNRRSLN